MKSTDSRTVSTGIADGTVELEGLEELIAEAFQHWLDGTYGLCTKHVTVREIVLKEVAIGRIRRLTENGTRKALSPEDRPALQDALRTLDTVDSKFAPDERMTSSREKWLNTISRRFGFNVPVEPDEREHATGGEHVSESQDGGTFLEPWSEPCA